MIEPMTLKREDGIRIATVDGQIPFDVDGDWQDFTVELLAELDRKRELLARIARLTLADDVLGFLAAAEVRALVAETLRPHAIAELKGN